MQINTSQVQIPNNDLLIDAYLVQPELTLFHRQ